MKGDARDPKGLIREAYRMPGITHAECRTIFLDWALSIPVGQDQLHLIRGILTQYADQPSDHPMTQVLTAALSEQPIARRRGGRAGRVPG